MVSAAEKDRSFGVIPIYWKDGVYYILLVQHIGGHWALPKGHPEKGETAQETARREFEEETGIKRYTLLDNALFTERYFFMRKGKKVAKTVRYFVGEVADQNVIMQPEEVLDYRWLTHDEALKRATHEGTRRLLRKVYRHVMRLSD